MPQKRTFTGYDLTVGLRPEKDVQTHKFMATREIDKPPKGDVRADDARADVFRRHFDRLPNPAYMWRDKGNGFVIVAYNQAAAMLPAEEKSDLGGNLTEDISRRLVSSFPEYFAVLEECAKTDSLIVDERNLFCPLTNVARRMVLTFVPVSSDAVILHTEDVTEARNAEEQLRLSEARLKEAQRIAKTGSWDFDLVNNELIWSDEVFEILEADRETFDLSYEGFLNTVHPEDRAFLNHAYTSSVKDKKPYAIEHRLVMPDGSIKYVSERCETFYDEQGNPLRSVGAVQDITERKEAQIKISELMTRLQALADVAFDDIVISEHGIVKECSDGFASRLGCELEELVGQPILDHVALPFRSLVQQNLLAQKAEPFEVRALRKDGSTFPVEVCGSTIQTGNRTLRVSAFRDISQRIELEREVVATSERERRRIGHDLHDGIGQLLFGTSLYLDRVCKQLEKEGSTELERVRNAQNLLREAIEESRRVSHLLAPTVYGANGLSTALTDLVTRINEHIQVNLTVDCPFKEQTTNPDSAGQLYRIAQESINNALKHSRAKNVQVICRRDGELLQLEVLDDGVGISAEEIVNPSGLGLRSMGYRARMIDGYLKITRRENGGTRVFCSCPI